MFIFTVETVLTFTVIIIFIVITAISSIKKYFKQRGCDHSDYWETMSCDAVCRVCGKNLGFIGTVRGDK